MKLGVSFYGEGGDKIWHANKPDDINVISEFFSCILFIL